MTAVAMWVVPVSNLAGVARHVLDVARVGLPGYELQVATPPGALAEELRRSGVPVHEVPLDGPPVAAARSLRRLVLAERPRVLHSHLARADFLIAAATLGLPPVLVSTEHGIAADPRLYTRGRIRAAARRALHHARTHRFDGLIAVSESTRHEMVRAWRPPRAIQVIRNGVDPAPGPARTPGLRFLTLSRLAPEKRLPAVLVAFAAVARTHEETILTVAGDGPERDTLVALAHRLNLGGRVTFPGHVDSSGALARHDVLVQLSAWENASYSLLDAVAHGLGVVATPVGGNAEILPPQCLSDADDTDRVALLMAQQACTLALRPALPDGWPTVSAMARQIAAVYDGLLR